MTATPGQADGPEIPVHLVWLWLCELCLDGKGGECHSPGCALFLNRAPDVGIRNSPMVTFLDAAQEPHAAPAQPPSPEPDGTVVIGPKCFASADRLIISWHGVNYYQLTKLEPLNAAPPEPKPAPELAAATVLTEVLDFLDGGIPPGDEFARQVAQWRKRGLPS